MAVANVYVDPPELDLSVCAYYQRQLGGDQKGTCSFGCTDEPECVTNEPRGGWPSEQRVYTTADTIVEIL